MTGKQIAQNYHDALEDKYCVIGLKLHELGFDVGLLKGAKLNGSDVSTVAGDKLSYSDVRLLTQLQAANDHASTVEQVIAYAEHVDNVEVDFPIEKLAEALKAHPPDPLDWLAS
jgi:hypothetical protein